ncbi:molybdopterin dinucleotide binding domain-containing protein [Methanogenium cariaci]|uniref:molybdopterin dinucleotide binding domain-containing protein n=1 Tax=Methanogenium cariaci TaxID=2197 RepID=UPI0009F8DAEE|nr:molybdopterin dinucleotide binding domain-containing protein [Methanogenium cariaci]
MAAIQINLISGRTIQQGVSMEGGKEKLAYRDACGILELDDAEFKRLGCFKNTNVRVSSEFGSVVVKAIGATQGPHPGLGWIPMGPWANAVVDPNTYSTGMPTFKGTPVTVEVAEEETVLDAIALITEECL